MDHDDPDRRSSTINKEEGGGGGGGVSLRQNFEISLTEAGKRILIHSKKIHRRFYEIPWRTLVEFLREQGGKFGEFRPLISLAQYYTSEDNSNTSCSMSNELFLEGQFKISSNFVSKQQEQTIFNSLKQFLNISYFQLQAAS